MASATAWVDEQFPGKLRHFLVNISKNAKIISKEAWRVCVCVSLCVCVCVSVCLCVCVCLFLFVFCRLCFVPGPGRLRCPAGALPLSPPAVCPEPDRRISPAPSFRGGVP